MNKNRLWMGTLFFLLCAGLVGCSCEGDLTIVNDSSAGFTGKLKGKTIHILPGEKATETVYIGKSLLFVGPDEIEVQFSGSGYTKRPLSETLIIKTGENTVFRIVDDAGAFLIKNNHTTYVSEIKYKLRAQSEFGPNLLEGERYLYPSATRLIQLDTGRYDFFIEYSKDELTSTFSDSVSVGEVKYHYWQPN